MQKSRINALILIFIALGLSYCDSASGPSGGATSAIIPDAPTQPTVYTHFAYQTSYWAYSSDMIAIYGIDPNDSRLDYLGQNFATAGTKSCVMVMHPNKKFLYVTNCNSDKISQYSINEQTGELTPLSPATISMNSTAIKSKEIGFDSNGDMYVSYFQTTSGIMTTSNLGRFTVNATTGKATFVSWVVAGNPSGQFENYLALHPTIQMSNIYVNVPPTRTYVLGQMSYVIQPGLDNINMYESGILNYTTFVNQPIMLLLK